MDAMNEGLTGEDWWAVCLESWDPETGATQFVLHRVLGWRSEPVTVKRTLERDASTGVTLGMVERPEDAAPPNPIVWRGGALQVLGDC
jgi:hypothetical protein